MKNKLVSIFLPTLNGGGAERAMVTLANSISERGFNVDLVLSSAEGPYLKDVISSVKVVDLNAGRVIKALIPLLRYLRTARPVALLSAMGHANVVALLAHKMARVPTKVVVSERGLISGEHKISTGIATHINYMLIPLIYPSADGICAVSKAAAKDLAEFIKIPTSQVKTIYNPFNLAHIQKLAAEPLEHPWFCPGQPPVILGIGRMNEAKDFPVLIHAFYQLHKKRKARLVILGEGELRPELEALLAQLKLGPETVQLPGFKSNPFSWLARSKLFVLSSRREGLPGVLIEAMACGVPIVSTNCLSGPDEILEDGRWGRIVPVGDINALAQAMMHTLDSPHSELPNVRLRAADFEHDRAVDAYLDILNLPRHPDKFATNLK